MTRCVRSCVLVSAAAVLALGTLGGCARPRGFHFDVTADMRGFTPPNHAGSAYFAGTCEAIRKCGPGAFMIIAGDLDPLDRVRATLSEVLGPDYVWYPVVGNHEFREFDHMPHLRAVNAGGRKLPGIVRGGPPGAEETCYSFDYEQAHFVVLNEYYDGQGDAVAGGDVSDALYAWLAEDLAANGEPFVFVCGHEPAVSMPDMSTGRVRHSGDSLNAQPEHNHRFWSLLREYDVVAYICGHSHNTSVAKINGVWQLDAGHARGLGDEGAPSTFMQVFVEPEAIWCHVYRADETGSNYRRVFVERLR